MNHRLILSLCDLTGNWAAPYAEAGYQVRLVDLSQGQDVRLVECPREPVHGILAAPPCTMFANSGARWRRDEKQILEALSVVDACLRLVAVCRPAWWALENPVGKLSRWLGRPQLRFHPWQFGDAWTKRTCLWGHFTPPTPLFTTPRPVQPERVCGQGSWLQKLGGKSDRTKRLRSETPTGFARAFFEANP